MTFLLEARPEDSKDAVSRVDNSMIRLSSRVKIFRAAYEIWSIPLVMRRRLIPPGVRLVLT